MRNAGQTRRCAVSTANHDVRLRVVQDDRIRASCCCPSFIVVIAGPSIRVLGAVFTDEAWADQLTEAISLGPDKIDGDQKIDTVALIACEPPLGTYRRGT
jgi:hypothetical protein